MPTRSITPDTAVPCPHCEAGVVWHDTRTGRVDITQDEARCEACAGHGRIATCCLEAEVVDADPLDYPEVAIRCPVHSGRAA